MPATAPASINRRSLSLRANLTTAVRARRDRIVTLVIRARRVVELSDKVFSGVSTDVPPGIIEIRPKLEIIVEEAIDFAAT